MKMELIIRGSKVKINYKSGGSPAVQKQNKKIDGTWCIVNDILYSGGKDKTLYFVDNGTDCGWVFREDILEVEGMEFEVAVNDKLPDGVIFTVNDGGKVVGGIIIDDCDKYENQLNLF